MKRLVVTADDFGLCPGVVEGIVEAHQRGIVTSTSVMVNAPASEAAFEEARRLPALASGLHFNLTFGSPVGESRPIAPLLDESGRFHRKGSGAHERARPGQVREELRSQLRIFESQVGRSPTHIDGHHHVHLHPGIFRVVVEEAGRLGIPVRSTDDDVRMRLRLEGIRTCDHFIDQFYGGGDRDRVREEALLNLLASLPDGTSELMCHPSREDPSLGDWSGYVAPRYVELQTLTAPRVREALARLEIELVSMATVEFSR
ncbi:MAG: carbohydrate deacetylase [Vicinamibacteria bacterium]